MKAVKSRIPTPPTLPTDARAPTRKDETDGPTGGARTEGASRGAVPLDELQMKFQERQSRASAAAKRAEGGREASARETGARRKPAGAEGGLEGALERIRQNMQPASGGETDGGDRSSVAWDE